MSAAGRQEAASAQVPDFLIPKYPAVYPDIPHPAIEVVMRSEADGKRLIVGNVQGLA